MCRGVQVRGRGGSSGGSSLADGWRDGVIMGWILHGGAIGLQPGWLPVAVGIIINGTGTASGPALHF